MTLIDRQFLMKQTSHMITHCMLLSISVQRLNSTIHNSDHYITVNIYLTNTDEYTVIITCKIHIVNNLHAKMLIDIDILVTEDIIMNLFHKVVIIESCNNIKVLLTITTKSINQINHKVLVKQQIIILSQNNLVLTVLQSDLFCNYDFLFKSNCQQTDVTVYVHIVDHAMMKVYVHNDSNISLMISQKS